MDPDKFAWQQFERSRSSTDWIGFLAVVILKLLIVLYQKRIITGKELEDIVSVKE